MNQIRSFLWTLAGIMSLQGFLHADEYGSSASFFGGMSLTMSIMQERLGTTTHSWFSEKPRFVGLPRIIVQAAIKETALHPGIQIVPKLQRILKTHQRVWDLFREEEITWLLQHSDLVGAVHSDPDAVALWKPWYQRLNQSTTELAIAKGAVCRIHIFDPITCDRVNARIVELERTVREENQAIAVWEDVMHLTRFYSAEEWLTAALGTVNRSDFDTLRDALARIHDIDRLDDLRLETINDLIQNMTLNSNQSIWIQRILSSLLTGEVWSACLKHIRLREGRIRDLMMVAGIQDMMNAHDRILNASLRVVSKEKEKENVQNWFGEMSGYAWFMPESMPSLVRRCVGQEAGDCTRIGPTEIVSLTDKEVKRSQIIGDWTRCVLIGMWNAMPIILILFIFELIVMIIPSHGYYRSSYRLEPRSTHLVLSDGDK